MLLTHTQHWALAILVVEPRETAMKPEEGYVAGQTAIALERRGLAVRRGGLLHVTDRGRDVFRDYYLCTTCKLYGPQNVPCEKCGPRAPVIPSNGGPSGKPRGAIYMRVSTEEQTYENQRPDIMRVADFYRIEVVNEWRERVSAGKYRPQFEEMMTAARAKEFDVLLLWAIDRLGRSMVGNLNCMLELDRLGIRILSHREPWLDTGGPVRPLLIAIFSWVAEQERAQISERTRAGMERARKAGHPIGHMNPIKYTDAMNKQILRLMSYGRSVRYIAKKLGKDSSSVWKQMKRLKNPSAGLFPNELPSTKTGI